MSELVKGRAMPSSVCVLCRKQSRVVGPQLLQLKGSHLESDGKDLGLRPWWTNSLMLVLFIYPIYSLLFHAQTWEADGGLKCIRQLLIWFSFVLFK